MKHLQPLNVFCEADQSKDLSDTDVQGFDHHRVPDFLSEGKCQKMKLDSRCMLEWSYCYMAVPQKN